MRRTTFHVLSLALVLAGLVGVYYQPPAIPNSWEYGGQSVVDPYHCFSPHHAPMGMADFGVDPGTDTPYNYSTTRISGEVTLRWLHTLNNSLPDYLIWGNTSVTFQLNTVLEFSHSGVEYVYWIQDVAFVNTTDYNVVYSSNIWNLSSAGARMYNSSVRGEGTVDVYPYQSPPTWFYGFAAWRNQSNVYGPGPNLGFTYLEVDTGLMEGVPTVWFRFEDPGPGSNNHLLTFDRVAFPFANGSDNLQGFVVNGHSRIPNSPMYYDSEIIMGGPGNGTQTGVYGSDLHFRLDYWNGHNWEAPPSAYNFGCDTAEGVYNAAVSEDWGWSNDPSGYLVSTRLNRPLPAGPLFSQTQTSVLTVTDPSVEGNVTGRVTVALSSGGVAYANGSFVNGSATLVLDPGTFSVNISVGNGTAVSMGICHLLPGVTLLVRANVGCSKAPLLDSFNVNNDLGLTGNGLQFSVKIQASSPVQAISYSNLPSGCTSENKTGFSCQTDATGIRVVTVTVVTIDGNVSRSYALHLESRWYAAGALTIELLIPAFAILAAVSSAYVFQDAFHVRPTNEEETAMRRSCRMSARVGQARHRLGVAFGRRRAHAVNSWIGMVQMTDSPQRVLSKDFSFMGGIHGRQFAAHVRSLREGKVWRWMLFSCLPPKEMLEEWNVYREVLRLHGVPPEKISSSVDCRVLSHEGWLGKIPWRIELFGDQVTLCMPEPDSDSYGRICAATALDSDCTKPVLTAFDVLWDLSRQVDDSSPEEDRAHAQKEAYEQLRREFVKAITTAHRGL